MKHVVIVMSTYNGSKYLEAQLKSIFCQKDVYITCFVRDDGSTDDTLPLLYRIKEAIGDKIIIEEGKNVGWEKSFMLALKSAPKGDYYAFSDQDDIWFEDKVFSGVKMMESKGMKNVPIMYHCNKLSVDEKLHPFLHQVRRTPQPLNRQNALIQEYAQGCSIILNEEARSLVTKHIPNKRIPHDFWCGLLCYLFGEIIYDNNPHFYHISHGNNASGEGHILNSWKERINGFWGKQHLYLTPYDDLIEGYYDMLTSSDIRFVNKIFNYRHSFKDKLSLLTSKKFIRDSFLGTISLKTAILFNKL